MIRAVHILLLTLLLCVGTGCVLFQAHTQTPDQLTKQSVMQLMQQNKPELKNLLRKTKRDLQVGHKVQKLLKNKQPRSQAQFADFGRAVIDIVKPNTQKQLFKANLAWGIVIALSLACILTPYLMCRIKKL